MDTNIENISKYWIKEYWKTKSSTYYAANKDAINEKRRKKYAIRTGQVNINIG